MTHTILAENEHYLIRKVAILLMALLIVQYHHLPITDMYIHLLLEGRKLSDEGGNVT
jgi:hypothetical protein